MELLSAMDLKNGKKTKKGTMASSLTQPIQFLPKKEKDEEWFAHNMDWLEWQGMKQLRRNSRRLLKNYKLANGIIDKSDYIVEDNPEHADIIEMLAEEDVSALELKFYPIIPNVVNTLTNEFSKRDTKIIYKSVDDDSYNEMLDQKVANIEEVLVKDAEMKLIAKLKEQGFENGDQEFEEALSPDSLSQLPQIQEFYEKDYRTITEQWAQHQHSADIEKFHMDELEREGFRDMLVTDREFFHFIMKEDDYEIELWNPVLTFYHKSPSTRYVSDGSHVGNIEMLTVADTIDKYGWNMTQEQLESLEALYPVKSAGYSIGGQQNDGSFYDSSKSHEWNTNMPSLGYRQYLSNYQTSPQYGDDVVSWILSESEDFLDFGSDHHLRVSTIYWKSQRKIGYLTKINDLGEVETDIVDEDYEITEKPVYNTNLFKQKTDRNLVYGEHIEWIWINDVYGGIKIGPNMGAIWGQHNPDGIDPIYLGINQNKPGRLKFQFKGDNNLYGSKLPVEGRVFSDRNSSSVALVDLMKPYQIGFNLVNNQIADILVDELGTVVAFDQNGLPRHSLGEDWGKNNLAKAYVAMKDFSMMPFDTTITNTESPLNMQNLQVLDLEQSRRLMSRVQLANHFRQQAFESIGISPQRMGQQIEQETAEGVRQAVNNSYALTEQYFIWHCDELMPRVHQMRTDLAQYYHSTNPSLRLQYLTTSHEKINFNINGTELMTTDINVYGTTKASHREILEKIRNLAVYNNTTGASIFDLGQMIEANNLADLNEAMKKSENKARQQREAEMRQQQELEEKKIASEEREKALERDHEAREAEKQRRKDILVAEIRAAGYGSMMDINENKVSDYEDQMKNIRESEQYQEQTNLKREQESNKKEIAEKKLNIDKQKLNLEKEKTRNQLAIARENKNKWDFKKKDDSKSKK